MKLLYTEMESPFGPLFVGVDSDGALVRISFLTANAKVDVLAEMKGKSFVPEIDREACAPVLEQLRAYFEKQTTVFSLPLRLLGTPFQCAVWERLQTIPYGECQTYGEIAEALGKPGGSRAVGLANNRNPIPIVVPCHRVIGANGHLVGFGGGLQSKIDLLRHEGYFMI